MRTQMPHASSRLASVLRAAAVSSALCGLASAKTPLSRFGYYYGDSEAYGHYMDKVVIPSDGTRLQDYTNLILIDIGTNYGQHNPRRAVIDAANLGYQVLLYGASGFEKDTPGTWQAGIDEYKAVTKGYERFIYAVDLTDEPDGRGWSRTQIESLVSQAKTSFRGNMPVTVNLDIPHLQAPPRNMDLYMFDYYVNGGGAITTKPQYDATVNGIIGGIRAAAPGKPMLMLGSSFNDNSIGFTRPTNEQTQWYFDTANNTPEIDGLMWYMLGNAPPTSTGAIGYPDLLAQHKQMGQQVLVPKPGMVVNDRVTYANSAAVSAVYTGVAPALTSSLEHGNNGGKCFQFSSGAETATRTISADNQPGSVEAFMFDSTFAASHQIGFRAVNQAGQSIAVYARGGSTNYLIDDQASGAVAVDSGIESLARWQKVEFCFDGVGVRVYADSQLVYLSPTGWSGGYSRLGFYDPGNTSGVGYIDDIRAFQVTPAGTTLNIGANQSLGVITLSGSTVRVGRDSEGNPVHADLTVNALRAAKGLANFAITAQSYNEMTVTTSFAIDENSTLVKQGAGVLNVNGAQTHSSGALLIAGGGTINLSTDAGSAVTANLNIHATSTVNFASSQHLNSLSVGSGGYVRLNAGGQSLQTRSIAIAGTGRLDLTDGVAAVDYTGPTGPSLIQIQSLLATGYAAGAWNGLGGITSATAATAHASGSTALGYAEAGDILSGAFPTLFNGAEVDNSTVLIRYTYAGDADLNGSVNSLDFNRFLSGYGGVVGKVWSQGDFNFDSKVNTLDFNLLAANFGRSLPSAAGSLGSVIPEPAGAVIAIAGVFLMQTRACQRRGRRVCCGSRYHDVTCLTHDFAYLRPNCQRLASDQKSYGQRSPRRRCEIVR